MSTSERSGLSGGPRSNPLYGGPPPANSGGRTPSWAKKNSPTPRDTAFSDVASSPPESPTRSSRSNYGPSYYAPQFENPGYTVETPGRTSDAAASPYRAPPYYVQTPGMSDRIGVGASPFSSAPNSPPHYGPNGTPYDARSMRSSKSRGGRVSAVNISKIEEEEEFYPDPERDAQRKRRWWRCCISWSFAALVVAIAAAAITLWFIFKPTEPTYTFQTASIQQFTVVGGQTDKNGLPTDQLYANVTLVFGVSNPNSQFTLANDQGLAQLGYSSIPTIMQGATPKFNLPKRSIANFSASISTMAYPLYGAGPGLRSDIAARYVPLQLEATLKSHINVVWKIITSDFTKKLRCEMHFDPLTLYYVNHTCSGLTTPVSN